MIYIILYIYTIYIYILYIYIRLMTHSCKVQKSIPIVGVFGMRKFRYRYTGKNIPVIPVYRYFGLVKS